LIVEADDQGVDHLSAICHPDGTSQLGIDEMSDAGRRTSQTPKQLRRHSP
jgi:hypothetical protein